MIKNDNFGGQGIYYYKDSGNHYSVIYAGIFIIIYKINL